MKQLLYSLLAAGLLAGLIGCQNGRLAIPVGKCSDFPAGCQTCQCENGQDGQTVGDPNCPICRGRDPQCPRCPRMRPYDPVPPSGMVVYPYYTTRGPRDFLAKNPRGIGP